MIIQDNNTVNLLTWNVTILPYKQTSVVSIVEPLEVDEVNGVVHNFDVNVEKIYRRKRRWQDHSSCQERNNSIYLRYFDADDEYLSLLSAGGGGGGRRRL